VSGDIMEKIQKESYSHTVFLPRTSFAMKANLSSNEPRWLKFWEENKIYEKMIGKGIKRYFLHDGPPYANGNIHIGHALNKILKDFVIKSYSVLGYSTPYVPGWDCHGLPIEQQLLKELNISKKGINDIISFRNKAKEFAQRFIDIQRNEFKRLGVLGEWEKPYITMSNEYEADVVEAFIELWEKGYIERDKKTIYWCIKCETALADAEVEYKDKVSDSIYVKFKVRKSLPQFIDYQPLYIVIWTTTPWTLPANMAVSVKEDEIYLIVKDSDEYLIIAKPLYQSFSDITGKRFTKVSEFEGKKLLELTYEPPLIGELDEKYRYERRVIATDFVDMTTGTGIVHIAPGHGEEDYFAGKKWNLDVFCPVDESGRFTDEVVSFKGINVFESNKVILERLQEKKLLISSGKISHSYPHCWRCKEPIIFRAAKQWFLKIDKNNLRNRLIEKCKSVKWVPAKGYERITSMIKSRPDWCLSRQRYWGTPIVAFYCKRCGEVQNDFNLLKKIAERIRKEGSDFWFRDDIKDIIGHNYRCRCGGDEFEKEKDILDVWLDSGVSWYSVCLKREKTFPVDLYLEGSDQHRGWFQTSLIPSVALKDIAPYKTVLTHGFVLDEEGKAMHKSLGNVVSPQDVIKKYGAEILRLWVALSDISDDVRISDNLLSVPVEMYKKIRNTFRYLLGNLSDFKPEYSVKKQEMMDIDRYILSKFSRIVKEILKDYENFEYRIAIRRISDFCINDLSSFYLDVLKDRVYTWSLNSKERRSAQTAMYHILKNLLILSSPILSFTSEEAWQVFRKEVDGSISESVFLSKINPGDEFIDNEIENKWSRIISIRNEILKEMEKTRNQQIIGSSLEAKVIIKTNDEFIFTNKEDIKTALIVSQIEVLRSDKYSVEVVHAEGKKCLRCWQWSVDVSKNERYPNLCPKCIDVVIKDNINV
jgi:isoleucyl-tRNA synthetase